MRRDPDLSEQERRFLAVAPAFLRRGLLVGALSSLLGAGTAAVLGRLWPALAGFGIGVLVLLGVLAWASLRAHFPPPGR